MSNLMIRTGGAIGDNFYAFPAVVELRKEFDEIYMCGIEACQIAFGDTGYVDKFIIKPNDFYTWGADYCRRWLTEQAQGLEFDETRTTRGAVPSKYMFHTADPHFNSPTEWKRRQNEGVSYFDATSLKLGASGAVGKRPATPISHKERSWLRDFRHMHEIPKDAFLLVWQFTGSSTVKWYPYFDEVMQKNIMARYPQVYVIALGDMAGRMDWDSKYHGGRYINLKDTVSFRQAMLITSIVDLLVSPETGVYVASQCFPQTPKILLATHTDGKCITCGDESVIIQSEAECSPCYRLVGTCLEVTGEYGWNKAAFCMSKIPPEKVIREIEAVIGRRTTLREGVKHGTFHNGVVDHRSADPDRRRGQDLLQ